MDITSADKRLSELGKEIRNIQLHLFILFITIDILDSLRMELFYTMLEADVLRKNKSSLIYLKL